MSVCLSVCLSQVGVRSERLNVEVIFGKRQVYFCLYRSYPLCCKAVRRTYPRQQWWLSGLHACDACAMVRWTMLLLVVRQTDERCRPGHQVWSRRHCSVHTAWLFCCRFWFLGDVCQTDYLTDHRRMFTLHRTAPVDYDIIQTAGLAFGGTGLCSYRVSGVDGSCAEHLTVESYTVFICQQSTYEYLVFHHPLTFIPGLNPSFSANHSHRSLPFLLRDSLHGFPRLFTVIFEHICFLLLVLMFLHFLVVGSVR